LTSGSETEKRATAGGVPAHGWFHWSLMDNVEWILGFEPKFGLFRTDTTTLERTPKWIIAVGSIGSALILLALGLKDWFFRREFVSCCRTHRIRRRSAIAS